MFKVLPIWRAFTEGDGVSVFLPILSSSPSEPSQNSSLCLGTSPVAASPSVRGMLALEGAAGVYTAKSTISTRAVKSTVGSSVTTSGHTCGFSLAPSACRALELHAPALLRNDSQDNILPSCSTQDFSLTLSSPGSAWCVFVRGPNQSWPCCTGLCFTSAGFPVGFIQLLLFLFFAVLMEAASWNYRKLPLSNNLLVKPTITAVSRPSEHS